MDFVSINKLHSDERIPNLIRDEFQNIKQNSVAQILDKIVGLEEILLETIVGFQNHIKICLFLKTFEQRLIPVLSQFYLWRHFIPGTSICILKSFQYDWCHRFCCIRGIVERSLALVHDVPAENSISFRGKENSRDSQNKQNESRVSQIHKFHH